MGSEQRIHASGLEEGKLNALGLQPAAGFRPRSPSSTALPRAVKLTFDPSKVDPFSTCTRPSARESSQTGCLGQLLRQACMASA
jgi:hypothetical protein